jgi:hypothetical protein
MTSVAATIPTAALPPGELELPGQAHRPGTGSTPEMALLEQAKAFCPQVTDAASWQTNRTYRYGWSLFAAGFYWEAHEVWEAVWLASHPNSLEQLFLKTAIQTAHACLKQDMGKDKAARRLFEEIAGLLAELKIALGQHPQNYMGVDLEAFAAKIGIAQSNK